MNPFIKYIVTILFIISSINTSYATEEDYKSYANDILGGDDNSSSPEGIKGQLQPVKHAVISSEITGSITKISVSDSDSFKKGRTLVDFKCNIERAELKKAVAAQKADKTRVEVNTKLEQLSSISQLDYKLAIFKAEESSAEVAVIAERVKNCKIKAPYSGVVEEILKQNHEFVNRGDPVIKILDTSVLEIELLVSSNWVTWLKKGMEFDVEVSELGKTYKAKVTNIGAKIDPVSQSIKIKGAISNKEKILKPGMSVTAYFKK